MCFWTQPLFRQYILNQSPTSVCARAASLFSDLSCRDWLAAAPVCERSFPVFFISLSCYVATNPGYSMDPLKTTRVCLDVIVLFVVFGACQGRDPDSGYVTCGSLVKLLNTRHNVRLHSHDVKYGSGSGQQSVTGVDSADDANSYWRIRGKPNETCQRGAPIKCGQAVRFTHMKTGRNLHTHHFSSPLSNNQEVSAFGENGEGDDLDVWAVQCSGTYWERDDTVRFKHVGTSVFLSVTGEQYGHPIRGQREVHGMPSPNQHNYWKVMEGVFIQPSHEPLHHDEL